METYLPLNETKIVEILDDMVSQQASISDVINEFNIYELYPQNEDILEMLRFKEEVTFINGEGDVIFTIYIPYVDDLVKDLDHLNTISSDYGDCIDFEIVQNCIINEYEISEYSIEYDFFAEQDDSLGSELWIN